MLEEDLLLALREETEIKNVSYDGVILPSAFCQNLEFQSVTFTRCRLSDGNFTKASFYDCKFVGCDLSNCKFSDSYWKNCMIDDCKCNGATFPDSTFKVTAFTNASFVYANLSESLLLLPQLTHEFKAAAYLVEGA